MAHRHLGVTLTMLVMSAACKKAETAIDSANAPVQSTEVADAARMTTTHPAIHLLIVGDGYSDPAPQEFEDKVAEIQNGLNGLPGADASGSSFVVKSMPLPHLINGLSQLGVTHTGEKED